MEIEGQMANRNQNRKIHKQKQLRIKYITKKHVSYSNSHAAWDGQSLFATP